MTATLLAKTRTVPVTSTAELEVQAPGGGHNPVSSVSGTEGEGGMDISCVLIRPGW